jgi:hypothetical protein
MQQVGKIMQVLSQEAIYQMYNYDSIFVAGINTKKEFQQWLANGKPNTGYEFVRKLDGLKMGNILNLGLDFSLVSYGLATQPRQDLIEYYEEVVESVE